MTGIRPVRIDGARVVDQEGARGELEGMLAAVLIANKVCRYEIFFPDLQAPGKAADVLSLEQRAKHFTAIPAFPAFDFIAYRPVVSVNDCIDFFA